MAEYEPQTPERRTPYIDESLAINTRLSKIEREDEEYKQRQLRFNKLTVIFTGCLVVANAIYVAATLYIAHQARVSADAAASAAKTASNTLAEMKKGGTDTHELASAAKRQADNTRMLAQAAVGQVGRLEAESEKRTHLPTPRNRRSYPCNALLLPLSSLIPSR